MDLGKFHDRYMPRWAHVTHSPTGIAKKQGCPAPVPLAAESCLDCHKNFEAAFLLQAQGIRNNHLLIASSPHFVPRLYLLDFDTSESLQDVVCFQIRCAVLTDCATWPAQWRRESPSVGVQASRCCWHTQHLPLLRRIRAIKTPRQHWHNRSCRSRKGLQFLEDCATNKS